jgi:catechol 2,3-dioxygenase-like lactoylglutathione lyase family enzyme
MTTPLSDPALKTSRIELLVNIDVPDLEQAVRFYTAALGMHVGRRFGASAVELLGLAAPVYLLVKALGSTPIPGASHARDYRRHWTPVHLDFAVPDLGPAVSAVLDAGGSQEGPIQDHIWGRMALMADPFGHGLCLLEWKGRGYDEIAEAKAT